MREHQLSLIKRWELDIESYNNGAKVRVSNPQCLSCINYIKGNALHCEAFANVEKPADVLACRKECFAYNNNSPIDIKIQNDRDNKVYGGLFGFCVGDVLGVPLEFSTREERRRDPVKELRAYGTYHQPFGTWSDDTSLTVCLIDAINNGYSINAVAKNFINFYKKAYFTPYGEVFDIGNSTRDSIIKMCAGKNPIDCGGRNDNDNGNGSLMRILPLAFYGKNLKGEELIKLIEEVSSLTHGHSRSKLACIFYTEFVIQIISGYEKEMALDNTIAFININCSKTYSDEFENFEKILSKRIINVAEDEIKSTGYVIDTLEAVLWTFFHANGYREIILNAINLGGDTDTIAAIVGGIAGTYYGLKDIPKEWIQNIAKKKELYQMFEKFYAVTDF